ncbi:ABC transporter ATP-binding protein [Actinoplanes sp. NPDC051343]|uniref:ABC transporter ATP-binding protein n=1 Tax=Actinoplanes sp. NPDC051343 TaxID=3363906 RepID=UPI0037AA2AEF
MIEARGLTKRYGDKLAVNDLSFTVRPGIVTGFLGPNGAGKSTTMRMILGLDRPTSGEALINGRPYTSARTPMQLVGALLDAKDVHGGRTARAHLTALVQSNGLPRRRVDEVLAMTGMTEAAGRRIKGFSLGMSQRLGIAAAMLGDPEILIFDEPVNGLDPEGILWIRRFMHSLADEGRTVFVSSHLMSEMENTAEHLIVIGLGKLLADMSTTDFIAANSAGLVRVRTPDLEKMLDALREAGLQPNVVDGHIELLGTTTEAVGELAAQHQLTLHELFTQRSSLEQAFMEMTKDSVEYQATGATVGSGQ